MFDLSAQTEFDPASSSKILRLDFTPISASEAVDLPEGVVAVVPKEGCGINDKLQVSL